LHEESITNQNPLFGTILILNNGPASSYNALQVQFQRTIARGLQALASYTWAHSLDFGSSNFALPYSRANSDFDLRSNAVAGISWDLPSISQHELAKAFANGWGLDVRATIRSAFPFNQQGFVYLDPATGQYLVGELDIVPQKPFYLHVAGMPGDRVINAAAFAIPADGLLGDAPRNFLRGYGATQFNLAARREFPIYRRVKLEFRAEAFNILNHPNFGYIDPTFTDTTFGQATQMLSRSLATVSNLYQQGGPRSMQFSLRLSF
jgi:hypothetical protein